MKKMMLWGFTALFAALLSAGCIDQLAEEISQESKPADGNLVYFTASMETVATKTALSNNFKVVWKSTDKIRVFNAANPSGVECSLTDGANTTNATFSGEVSGEGPYYAIYPSTAITSLSPAGVVGTFPLVQKFESNSFGDGANIALAKSATTDFSFRNVGGALELNIMSEVGSSWIIKEIHIHTLGTELLNGSATVTGLDTESPALSIQSDLAGEQNRSLTLDCGDGVALIDGSDTKFYIVVPSGALADGFVVELIDDQGRGMAKAAAGGGANTIHRSMVRPMPSLTYAPAYKAAFLTSADSCAVYSHVLYTDHDNPATPLYEFAAATSQYAWQTGESTRMVRFQDWSLGYAITLETPKDLYFDDEGYEVTVNAYGTTGVPASSLTKVAKRTAERVWLAGTDGMGYIMLIK